MNAEALRVGYKMLPFSSVAQPMNCSDNRDLSYLQALTQDSVFLIDSVSESEVVEISEDKLALRAAVDPTSWPLEDTLPAPAKSVFNPDVAEFIPNRPLTATAGRSYYILRRVEFSYSKIQTLGSPIIYSRRSKFYNEMILLKTNHKDVPKRT